MFFSSKKVMEKGLTPPLMENSIKRMCFLWKPFLIYLNNGQCTEQVEVQSFLEQGERQCTCLMRQMKTLLEEEMNTSDWIGEQSDGKDKLATTSKTTRKWWRILLLIITHAISNGCYSFSLSGTNMQQLYVTLASCQLKMISLMTKAFWDLVLASVFLTQILIWTHRDMVWGMFCLTQA